MPLHPGEIQLDVNKEKESSKNDNADIANTLQHERTQSGQINGKDSANISHEEVIKGRRVQIYSDDVEDKPKKKK